MKKEIEKKRYIFEYNMGFIMIISLVLFVLPVILTLLLPIEININLDDSGRLLIDYAILFGIIFLWMVLHEIIHGVAYQLNGAKKENITYGVALEKGIFFCKCGEFVTRKNIMISVIAPFILIGVVTYIIGIITNSLILIILSIFNISGAAGDLTMFYFFLKQDKDIKFKELGDSTTFCLETKEDLTKKKYLGVKLKKEVENEDEIIEKAENKINITKASKIILIALLILMIVLFIIGLLV